MNAKDFQLLQAINASRNLRQRRIIELERQVAELERQVAQLQKPNSWQLGNLVSFGGRAYYITAVMIDHESNRTHYTLNNADRRHEYLTVCKAT